MRKPKKSELLCHVIFVRVSAPLKAQIERAREHAGIRTTSSWALLALMRASEKELAKEA
jgi:hypothetical protein